MSDTDLGAELNADDPNLTGEEPPNPDAEVEPKDPASEAGEAESKGEEEKPEPMVPVSVLTAEREEARRRLEFAESVARQSAKPAVEEPKVDPVDFLAEPEKIAGFIDERVRQATEGLSRGYAVRQHGKDVVDKAYAAAKDHGTPAEQQALLTAADPWGEIVDWHKRREALAEIGGDPEAWRKAQRESIKKELLAEAAVRQAKGLDPPPSLAGEPNTGARAESTELPDDSLEKLVGE